MPFVKSKIQLFLIGFTSILSQLLLLREFLNVFEGNELIIGLYFCIWMSLTGMGSYSASKPGKARDSENSGFLLLIMNALAIGEIAVLYCTKAVFFQPGTDISLPYVVLISLPVLFPLCFISGRLFTFAAEEYSLTSGTNRIASAYAWECIGSILAGLLFTTSVPFILTSFQLLSAVMLLNILLFLTNSIHRKKTVIIGVLTLGLFTLLANFAERPLQKNHFRGQELLQWKNTPYGNISITKAGDQYNVYINSTPLRIFDPYYFEEPVHFTLLQHPYPESVLVLSGGLNQTNEILKYPSVKSIDYIEINKDLIAIEQKYSEPVTDGTIKIFVDDARRFIRNTHKKYSAIIMNVPDPSTAQINRYFTKEFFTNARKILHDSGIVTVSLDSPGNYMNNEALQLNGIIYTTLKSVFSNVTVIPGERNYYIASEAKVSARMINRMNNSGIVTTYVNSNYFDDELLDERSQEIISQIGSKKHPVNSDLSPIAYFVHTGYMVSKSGSTYGIYILALVILSAIVLLLLRHPDALLYRVFFIAFAGSAGQFLLAFTFQVLFGNLYRMLGILTAFYMAGLVVGSSIPAHKLSNHKTGNFLAQLVMTLLFAGLALFALIMRKNPGFSTLPVQLFLLILSFLIAFSASLVFNITSVSMKRNIIQTAGTLYAIDLAGASAGSVIISMLFLPLFGFINSCLIVGLSVIIVGVLFIRR